MRLLAQFLGLACLVLPSLAVQKPKVPLNSTSRWIVDQDGKRVKLRCINWAGHMEVNIPEGLHKQTIDYIADWIVRQKFNCVRLTYSIDMALNPSRKVSDSFRIAAPAAGVPEKNLTALYDEAVKKNPFLRDATVIDVFDVVQATLWDKGIMTILDNHISKAGWCCTMSDGNGWWQDAPGYMESNSRYFDTEKWHDGLTAMARWSAGRPGIVGLSLRNELRASWFQLHTSPDIWRLYMPRAAKMIHTENPDALIIVGAIFGGTDLTPLRINTIDTTPWKGKNVWEAHQYSFTVTTPSFGSCDLEKLEYGALFGFVLEQERAWTGPLWMSEFGVGMTGGPKGGLSQEDYDYLTCFVSYMEGNDADWALWAIQGSYYVRDSIIDHDETWGALDHTWTDWRKPDFVELLGKMWNVTQGPWERR